MAHKDTILKRAQKYIQKGSLDKAIAEYRAAADLDPRDISIRLRIGELYIKQGLTEEAIREYTEAARANARQGFYLKAIAVYKQVLKFDPSNLDVHSKLADLYTKKNLIADAVVEYRFILNTLEKKGMTVEAVDLLKKMIALDPENTGIRLKLAELYKDIGYEKDALNLYSDIFAKLLSRGNTKRAEEVYRGLLGAYPKEPRILKGLAGICKERGDNEGFVRFSGLLPGVYREAGQLDEAREVYEETPEGVKAEEERAQAAGAPEEVPEEERSGMEL